jgi:hypothetical protein
MQHPPSRSKFTPKPAEPTQSVPSPAVSAVRLQEDQRRPPVSASFVPDKAGGGLIKLEYMGALADCEAIRVRLGERRAGRDWVNTRDVDLEKAGRVASAKIVLVPGESIEGASFAFWGRKGNQELWDNAGRSFGCYVFDAKTGSISTR